MKITIFGTGYVGLITGACLAETGNQVLCMDVDEGKIEALKRGVIPIREPGLQDLVVSNTKSGRLSFTTAVAEAVKSSDLLFIAVGTPPNIDGSADLRHALRVATDIGKYMEQAKIIVTKSTGKSVV